MAQDQFYRKGYEFPQVETVSLRNGLEGMVFQGAVNIRTTDGKSTGLVYFAGKKDDLVYVSPQAQDPFQTLKEPYAIPLKQIESVKVQSL